MKKTHWWGIAGYVAGALTGAWIVRIFKKV